MQASVAFTAPASNGGSAITGYTVTSSPGSVTKTGTSSPLLVTGLTNGNQYTFTVIATNAVGNSVPSSVTAPVTPNCGAFVTSVLYKVFACYNLGATDTTVDPNIPVEVIHGNYYKWGTSTSSANTRTYSTPITGWSTISAADNSWGTSSGDRFKNAINDPCPTGFRVPTNGEWVGVINPSLNTVSRTGSWTNVDTNFSTAIHFGTPTVKTLTLPASGLRDGNTGTLYFRGNSGDYWSSTENGVKAQFLLFSSTNLSTNNDIRTSGFSVRCISE